MTLSLSAHDPNTCAGGLACPRQIGNRIPRLKCSGQEIPPGRAPAARRPRDSLTVVPGGMGIGDFRVDPDATEGLWAEGRPAAYVFFRVAIGGRKSARFGGPVTQKQQEQFAENSRNLTRGQALVSASASCPPAASLQFLRWEAPSLLTVFFLGGGTLRLAAR